MANIAFKFLNRSSFDNQRHMVIDTLLISIHKPLDIFTFGADKGAWWVSQYIYSDFKKK